jgi:hypothetical protein
MAGDWIKVQICTPDKPEVHQLAESLGIDPDAVVGKLLRIWVWADQQTIDGNARSVTKSLLDRVTSVTGFADAMLNVGWLTKTEAGFAFPNFDRHNGQTAKKRSLNSARQAKFKEKEPKIDAETGNAPSVTKALLDKRREDKSIEEKNIIKKESEESILLEFPCHGNKPTWGLSQSFADDLAKAFPTIDILGEARKALVWLKSNNLKTAAGMSRFLNSWMGKANNSTRLSGTGWAVKKPIETRMDNSADKYSDAGAVTKRGEVFR